MDIQKYIASGILENYVLGLVSDEERREVEAYVLKYPEIEAEIVAIEDTLSIYSQTKAMPMPEGLKEQINTHIANLAGSTSIKEKDSTALKDKQPTTEQPPTKSGMAWWNYLLGLLTVLGLTAAAFFYQQSSNLRVDLSTMNQRSLDQQLICDEISRDRQQLQEQLNILRNDAYRSILLKGTDKAPDAIAAVYYNSTNQKTFLDIRNLPAPITDKQYQLWAIVDGAPVDMGVFDIPPTATFVEVPFIANAQAFAVTLEPTGGKDAPSMEEMYVIGNT